MLYFCHCMMDCLVFLLIITAGVAGDSVVDYDSNVFSSTSLPNHSEATTIDKLQNLRSTLTAQEMPIKSITTSYFTEMFIQTKEKFDERRQVSKKIVHQQSEPTTRVVQDTVTMKFNNERDNTISSIQYVNDLDKYLNENKNERILVDEDTSTAVVQNKFGDTQPELEYSEVSWLTIIQQVRILLQYCQQVLLTKIYTNHESIKFLNIGNHQDDTIPNGTRVQENNRINSKIQNKEYPRRLEEEVNDDGKYNDVTEIPSDQPSTYVPRELVDTDVPSWSPFLETDYPTVVPTLTPVATESPSKEDSPMNDDEPETDSPTDDVVVTPEPSASARSNPTTPTHAPSVFKDGASGLETLIPTDLPTFQPSPYDEDTPVRQPITDDTEEPVIPPSPSDSVPVEIPTSDTTEDPTEENDSPADNSPSVPTTPTEETSPPVQERQPSGDGGAQIPNTTPIVSPSSPSQYPTTLDQAGNPTIPRPTNDAGQTTPTIAMVPTTASTPTETVIDDDALADDDLATWSPSYSDDNTDDSSGSSPSSPSSEIKPTVVSPNPPTSSSGSAPVQGSSPSSPSSEIKPTVVSPSPPTSSSGSAPVQGTPAVSPSSTSSGTAPVQENPAPVPSPRSDVSNPSSSSFEGTPVPGRPAAKPYYTAPTSEQTSQEQITATAEDPDEFMVPSLSPTRGIDYWEVPGFLTRNPTTEDVVIAQTLVPVYNFTVTISSRFKRRRINMLVMEYLLEDYMRDNMFFANILLIELDQKDPALKKRTANSTMINVTYTSNRVVFDGTMPPQQSAILDEQEIVLTDLLAIQNYFRKYGQEIGDKKIRVLAIQIHKGEYPPGSNGKGKQSPGQSFANSPIGLATIIISCISFVLAIFIILFVRRRQSPTAGNVSLWRLGCCWKDNNREVASEVDNSLHSGRETTNSFFNLLPRGRLNLLALNMDPSVSINAQSRNHIESPDESKRDSDEAVGEGTRDGRHSLLMSMVTWIECRQRDARRGSSAGGGRNNGSQVSGEYGDEISVITDPVWAVTATQQPLQHYSTDEDANTREDRFDINEYDDDIENDDEADQVDRDEQQTSALTRSRWNTGASGFFQRYAQSFSGFTRLNHNTVVEGEEGEEEQSVDSFGYNKGTDDDNSSES